MNETTVLESQQAPYNKTLSIVRLLSEHKVNRDIHCKFKASDSEEPSEYLRRLHYFETRGLIPFNMWKRNRNT